MDISIIIVSWNIKERLRENLSALYKSVGGFSFEVFVVDNNSSDGTAEMVKKEFPQVYLIANNENLGFAKANNQAIKFAKGRYVLLLNPDMRVFPDTLTNMIRWMDDNQKASVAGCKLISENGEIVKHIRRFPTFTDQLAIILKLPHLFPKILNKYIVSDFDYEKSAKVDTIRGAFFMIRRETIEKIGTLDERYFLWFEEVDYCKKVQENGGEVWYMASAKCVDYVGQSFNQVKFGAKQKYFRDSMLKYFKKWHPVWQYYILRLAWVVSLAVMKILRF